MITPPRTKVKSENPAIPFYITRSQKLVLIAPPNQIFPRLTSQTIRGMGMESHSSRIVLPIEKYFPWPKHGIQRSRSLSITCCLLMRIPLAVENFFYRSRNFCRSNIFHVREFFIDGEFLHRYDREFKIFENDSEFHDRSWSQYWSTVFFGAITQQTKYKGK